MSATDWNEELQRNTRKLKELCVCNAHPVLLEHRAILFLWSYYRGTWRTVWAILKWGVKRTWRDYGWLRWEWVRTRIFRRPKDEMLAEADRIYEEEDQVQELLREL